MGVRLPPPPPGFDHDDKTEFMIIGTRQQLRKLQAMNIKVGSSEIKPSSQVRNLGCWLDSNLYMRDHITNVCKATITLDALRSIYRETSYDLLWYTHFLVRQVRCPQLVEGTFPLSYYSFDTLIKLLLLLLLLLLLFIMSRLDYCNALLYGLPKEQIAKLQRVQNAAARLIMDIGKYSHITPVLYELHWLPVQARIHFKILLLAFKAIHGLAPYISAIF